MTSWHIESIARNVRSAFAMTAALCSLTAVAAEFPRAEIRTTSYGVPHIIADDFVGAGFGAGYAFAKNDICEIAPRWTTVSAQRSRYFGPHELEPFGPGFGAYTNLQSDFFWQWIIDERVIERELNQPPPAGPTRQVRDMVRGYVLGYNHYLAETGVDKLPDPRCRGAEWVRPITEREVYLRALHWSMFLSSGQLLRDYVAASPPFTGIGSTAAGANAQSSATVPYRIGDSLGMPGSNMIALGRRATEQGGGMLFSNPHWVWSGPDRFFETQLTVRGKMNVYGASLVGTPMVLFGHTDKVAWSHTLSTPKRYTIYKLKLVPQSSTSYLYDGMVRRMTPRTVAIEARHSTGRMVKHTHTFWSTHYGLVLESKTYPWTSDTAYAVRDVAIGFRWLNQQLAMNRARSVGELDAAGKRYLGVGWLNTMAADSSGKVLFADRSAVPHVTNEKLDSCSVLEQSDRGSRGVGVSLISPPIVLEGSRSACEWGNDSSAPIPGIFGVSALPQLAREDYVTNSNDSYWTNNLHQPLENYPRIMGDERTPRTLRTRIGLKKIEDRLNGKDGYPGARFNLRLLETITMDNRVYSAELWRDSVVERCRKIPANSGVSEACDVLARWDLTEDLDARGAVLWRRFMATLVPELAMHYGPLPSDLFAVPFDPADPMNTPRGLANDPQVVTALKDAMTDLRDSAIPLDAALREHQYDVRVGERIPIPGGYHGVGQYNLVLSKGWMPGEGYPHIVLGSSYLMWVQLDAKGPHGGSVMSYSQSANPESPHYSDQTRLFSQKQSKPILFEEKDILADPKLETRRICLPADSAVCKRFLQ